MKIAIKNIVVSALAAAALTACSPKQETDLKLLPPQNSTLAFYSKTDAKLKAEILARKDFQDLFAALSGNEAIAKKMEDGVAALPKDIRNAVSVFAQKEFLEILKDPNALIFDSAVVYTTSEFNPDSRALNAAAVVKFSDDALASKIREALGKISKLKKTKIGSVDAFEFVSEDKNLKIKAIIASSGGVFAVSDSDEIIKDIFAKLKTAPKKSVFDNPNFARVVPQAEGCGYYMYADVKLFSGFAPDSEKHIEAVGFKVLKYDLKYNNSEVRLLFKKASPWAKLFSYADKLGAAQGIVKNAVMYAAMSVPRIDDARKVELEKGGMSLKEILPETAQILFRQIRAANFSLGDFDGSTVFSGVIPPFALNLKAENADELLASPAVGLQLDSAAKSKIGKFDAWNISGVSILKVSDKQISISSLSDAKLFENPQAFPGSGAMDSQFKSIGAAGGFFSLYFDQAKIVKIQAAVQKATEKRMAEQGLPQPNVPFADFSKAVNEIYKKYDVSAAAFSEGDIILVKVMADYDFDFSPLAEFIKNVK